MSGPPGRIDPPESPPSFPSSGARTPPLPSPNDDNETSSTPPHPSPGSPSGSYLSSMFTGIIRRFSAEDSQFSSQVDAFLNGSSSEPNSQQTSKDDGVNGVFQPAVRRTASPFRPPPLDPLVLCGYKENTPGTARLLTQGIAEEIRTMVPERLRITEDWRVVYSLEQDGASLSTLYQRCRMYEGRRVGFVLVVKDQYGGVGLASSDSRECIC